MSVDLTEKQYLMLSQFAYLDFTDEGGFNDNYRGKKLSVVADELLREDPETGQPKFYATLLGENGIDRQCGGLDKDEFLSLLESIADVNNAALGNLTMTGFDNRNSSIGFVAYAFKNSDTEDTVFAFRGTESKPAEGHGIIDWFDNVTGYGLVDYSYQYGAVEDFIMDHKSDGQIYVTGHSKGGANAAYACATFEGVTGVTNGIVR